MKRVREFGRRLVSSRVNGVIIAATLGVAMVLAQKGQSQQISTKVYASSLESVAMNMVVKQPPKPVDCNKDACVALTFDDGPEPATTPRILDALESENAKATFFVIGNHVPGHESIVQREHALGNEVGNHSWSHPNFAKLTPVQMQDQLNKTQDIIVSTGVPAPRVFRLPYGSATPTMLNTIHMPIILWNVDPKDWHENNPANLVSVVEAQARPGAIIIMHDSKPTTAAAAHQIVQDLKAKYNLVTVSELLQLPADAQGEYFGHPAQ